MEGLTGKEIQVLGKMRFDRYYRTANLQKALGVDRKFMLGLEKKRIAFRKNRGSFGSSVDDVNFESWYKKRKI